MVNYKRDSSKIKFMLVFLVPTFLLYILFFVVPIFDSVKTSFYNWSGYTVDMEYIGFKNYLNIFNDEVFLKAVKNDFLIVLGKEILILILSIFFAIALTRLKFKKAETAFYRFIFFFPNVLSVIIIAIVWSFVLHPSIGIVNSLLNTIGLDSFAHAWLGEYETVIPSIVMIASWAGIGFFMIVLIAAINDVPEELYEAAEIDGASEFVQLIRITIPRIWVQIKFIIITTLYQTLVYNFNIVMPITNGGPDNASQVMGLYVYQLGIQNNQVGYANAAAVVLLIITVTISYISNKLLSKEVDQ